ncbi:MAG: hypothetical protein A3K19_04480 [Lentisphaerae bacterium RIFOXYB12_FULL_65_16]|nr:MAG: hypothetical protein A3K18_34950 [Lentisphaerae bacterium RIFOXYA12_64_32]OGV84576.1 MAG: hypothetical protein A3K19_04480 [Lentisphaerae bacterium RIFOXYB12_FULL_65_16]
MGRKDSGQRQRILDAAVAVFGEHGLKGATTRRVGTAAGVNSALIYYYFEDKEELFSAAVAFVFECFLDDLRRGLRPFRGARDRLAYLVDGVLGYYSAHPERLRLMALTLNQHPDLLGQVLDDVVAKIPPVPVLILQEGIDRKELRRMPPIHAWWSILALCLVSLQVQAVMRHIRSPVIPSPPPGMAERRTRILDLLMNGLAVHGAKTGSAKLAAKQE